MKTVMLLTTGGTIASSRDEKTGLLVSGGLTGEKLAELCSLPSHIKVMVESVFQIPSNHMTFEKLLELKNKIEGIYQNPDIDGIVITHGTDTLEETAYFLDLTIADERPVVITGSQRGPLELGTDAFTNIKHAVLVAAEPSSRNNGTTVLFNEKIWTARHVKKGHASNLDAFHSPGFGYIGIVDQEQVYYYQKPILRENYSLKKVVPLVEGIKLYLGNDGKFIEYAVQIGAKGIVLEGAGRGHIPPATLEAVSLAIKKGIKVVLTTSADEGEVYPVYTFPGSAYDLQTRGVILGKDYDSKKARIKLAVLLAADITDIEKKFQQ